jgi:hypothetical protein
VGTQGAYRPKRRFLARAVVFGMGSVSYLHNLRFADLVGGDEGGGAILVQYQGSAVITACAFESNVAVSVVLSSAQPRLSCMFAVPSTKAVLTACCVGYWGCNSRQGGVGCGGILHVRK